MAFPELLFSAVLSNPLSVAVTIICCVFAANSIYNIFFHPLAHLKGPLLPKVTSLWLYYHSYIGNEASKIRTLHAQYGPLLRVAPNHVDIADADAIQAIYVAGGGFTKSLCYLNFDIDNHATIFSTLDSEYRTPRAKAISQLFSTANIRNNSALLYKSVEQMVVRMQHAAVTGRPVNVLNLARSLAVDIVSTHVFQMNYNGISETTERVSITEFLDAFATYTRIFYIPAWSFGWVQWGIDKFMDNKLAKSSTDLVEKFVNNIVSQTQKGDPNYPGRLMDLGVQTSEIKSRQLSPRRYIGSADQFSELKDLVFAGTDATAMNIAMICRYLALNQDKLKRVRKELEINKSSATKCEIQSLPYLSAVIKEALRISMANPTRLPRQVPAGGWKFKSTFFPQGTDVGCAAYELHLDPKVFADPEAFCPERWLTEDATALERMNKNWFAFGAGPRACIARNLAMTELYMGTERLVESGVLIGAEVCQDNVEIYEWFNSSVKGGKIELIWPTQNQRAT